MTVDTAFLGINTYASIKACTAIGTAIMPGYGTAAGAVIGVFVGLYFDFSLDYLSREPRRYFKSWVK